MNRCISRCSRSYSDSSFACERPFHDFFDACIGILHTKKPFYSIHIPRSTEEEYGPQFATIVAETKGSSGQAREVVFPTHYQPEIAKFGQNGIAAGEL